MSGQILAPRIFYSGDYACDGVQHNDSFCLDYNSQTYIKDVTIIVEDGAPGQFGFVTLCIDTVDTGGQVRICGCTGTEMYAAHNYGDNALPIPAAQALAIEWKGTGGGTRRFSVSIGFSGAP